jgi:hypothetical protein
MARSMSHNATRATARVAGVAALLVAGVMLVQAIMQSMIDSFGLLAFAASPVAVGYPLGAGVVESLASTAAALALSIVPVALGVFLAFWLLVPVTAELRVVRVVLRSVAAAGIATAVVLAVGAVSAIGGVLASAGPLFGNAFPRPDGTILVHSFASLVQSALFTFVAVTPVVVLAGVVVWLWIAKTAPGRPAPGEVTRNP